MSVPEPPGDARGPLPEEFLAAGKAPLLYYLLMPSRRQERKLYRVARSTFYRAEGYEVGRVAKPISKCFGPAPPLGRSED